MLQETWMSSAKASQLSKPTEGASGMLTFTLPPYHNATDHYYTMHYVVLTYHQLTLLCLSFFNLWGIVKCMVSVYRPC